MGGGEGRAEGEMYQGPGVQGSRSRKKIIRKFENNVLNKQQHTQQNQIVDGFKDCKCVAGNLIVPRGQCQRNVCCYRRKIILQTMVVSLGGGGWGG